MNAQLKYLQPAYYYQEPSQSTKGRYHIIEVQPHATGLRLPSHMAVMENGTVLVGEFAGGVVRDVTEAGDYSHVDKGTFFKGMQHPGGIHQLSNGRVIAADSGTGKIYDISKGGTASESNLIFTGVPHPYGIIEYQGGIYTTFSNNSMAGIAKIQEGEKYVREKHTYVTGFPVVLTLEPYRTLVGCGGSWTGSGFGNRLLFSHSALGAVFDVTNGGVYEELRDNLYAWGLDRPLGMTTDPIDGHVYICERGAGVIKRIHPNGGYSRFAEPLLAGFRDCSCIRFTKDGKFAYICDRAVGTVYRAELLYY